MQSKSSLGWFGRLVCACALVSSVFGFDLIRVPDGGTLRWDPGTVTVQIKLGDAANLFDGSSFNSNAQTAINLWNARMATLQFNGQVATTAAPTKEPSAPYFNEIGFDSKIYGTDDFDANVLAVTMTRFYQSTRQDGSHPTATSDIVVNSGKMWNSYRGPRSAHAGVTDIQRVILHELGHMLGLDHPDEAEPVQSVTAIMNAFISDLDTLSSDDIAGVQSLYGVPGGGDTAPSITSHPGNQSVSAGNSATFSINASGTPAPTYQWQRLPAGSGTWTNLGSGGGYSGVTTMVLTVSGTTAGMTGDQFRCVATNTVGSATSNAATLTVSAPTLPVISGLPASITVVYNGSISFSPTVTGTAPITYQWKKDGVALQGATSSFYFRNSQLPADSGNYTLTATNPAGSTTSAPVVVTVNAAIAPSITQQPAHVTAPIGGFAAFSVIASGTEPLSYQWYFNGQAIAGATSSIYSINQVTAFDVGAYRVTVTNPGGSITSSSAILDVEAATPPQIEWSQPLITISTYGNSFSFNPYVTGTTPRTYQWYKDGVAIPGATSLYYNKSGATAADAGTYTLRASNVAGVAVSDEVLVEWSAGAVGRTWLESARLGNIAYFLVSSPARIMRYDLAQEAWLPIVELSATKTATAFLPTAEGVFVAYDRELVRRSVDLQTEAPVTTNPATIRKIFSAGTKIFAFDETSVHSWDRATLVAGPDSPANYSKFVTPPVYSPVTQNLYSSRGGSPNDIVRYAVAPNGAITDNGDSPYHGDFRIGSRHYFSPDGAQLFDNSGVVYNTATLNYVGSLGMPFADLVFLSNGTPVVMRGKMLVAHGGSGFAETGRFAISNADGAIFALNNDVFAFTSAASVLENPAVAKVNASAFSPLPSTAPGSPVHKMFSIESVFIDSQSVVHLLSRSERGIIRWDAKTGAFASTLPLRGAPKFSSYAPAADRLTLAYSDGTLTDLFPGSATNEDVFGYVPTQNTPMALVAMDELTFLNIHEADVSADLRIIIGMLGEVKSLSQWNYWPLAHTWASSARRLYSGGNAAGNGSMQWITIPSSGELPLAVGGTVSNGGIPLRFGIDEALALSGEKRIVNADLQQVGVLTNAVSDGAWLSDGLYTIRALPGTTELQQWAPVTFAHTGSLTLPGTPVRIFRVNATRLVVLTSISGYLACHLVDANRTLVSSSSNGLAAFITQQPVSRTGIAGASVTFTVTATGSPTPTYQWKKNGVNIPGATNASYTIPSVQFIDVGSYTVVATNSAGSVTSNAAVLTVTAPTRGDFNLDGVVDVSWQNPIAGQRSMWLMEGTNYVGGVDVAVIDFTWRMVASADFNGDGKADILWQNTSTGQRYLWLMNGTAHIGDVDLGVVDLLWTIVGAGDFNGDGKADILWQNTFTGQRVIWFMNGTAHVYDADLGVVDLLWTIAGAGDFNADGKADILWQNTYTGQRVIWFMNGGTHLYDADLGVVDTSWTMAGAGDFNSDGRADIAWQNTYTGQRVTWFMNGGTHLYDADLGVVDTVWSIATAADFNGDGKADILWQLSDAKASDFNKDGQADLLWQNNATGERVLWFMRGINSVGGISLASIDPSWSMAATADFNNDGQTDIFWQNTVTGQRLVWLMRGTAHVSDVLLGFVPPSWSIVATADFTGDRQADILWQNTSTGQRVIWVMDHGAHVYDVDLGYIDTSWSIAGAADFNSDGQTDILWQNTVTGQRVLWMMARTIHAYDIVLTSVNTNWSIAAVADYNSDKQPDLVWQNLSTGERRLWLMVGTTKIGDIDLGAVDSAWSIVK